MHRLLCLIILLGLAAAPLASASEALDAELFPAEFLSAQREALGLSETQLQAIDELMRAAKTAFDEGKAKLDEAARALQVLLKEDQPDPDKADEKMRVVLDHEGDIKMLHLHTLLAVRRQLTAGQLAKAREIRDQLMAKAAANATQRQRIEKKLEELRTAIHLSYGGGTVPPEVVQSAQEIQRLMNENKDTEAEKKVEDTLTLVNAAKPKP